MLKDEIKKRIETVMIGSIVAIEKEMGYLFGQDEKNPTREQLAIKKQFLKARTRILNLGNKEIEKLSEDFKKYDIKGPRYTYKWTKE